MVAIEGDSGQIQQVIMNLIINAADAYGGQAGAVEIVTAVHTITPDTVTQWQDIGQTVQPGRYVCLSVADEGQGMDEFTLARIFDPFFTTKTTGRGLGLAAVQGIIRGHQGAIHIDSKPGKGTRFDVLFPISQNSVAISAAESVAVIGGEKTAVTPLPGNLILIVDDEKVIRNAISEVLQLKGYRVLEADNGHLAVSLYKEHAQEISLVLLDMTMPGMSGKETLHALCQQHLQAPVILMSGYNKQEIDPQTRQDVVAGFLKKPFRITTLMETISTILSVKPTNGISASVS
jgi:CheY-like chemotaxis protein